MCHFINDLRKILIPKPGFLDTEEKVREACESLRKATEEDFKKLDNAKRQSLIDARKILLD